MVKNRWPVSLKSGKKRGLRARTGAGLGAVCGLSGGWRFGGFRGRRSGKLLANGLAALAQRQLVSSNAVEARFVSVDT
jgi:hypothetical protein